MIGLYRKRVVDLNTAFDQVYQIVGVERGHRFWSTLSLWCFVFSSSETEYQKMLTEIRQLPHPKDPDRYTDNVMMVDDPFKKLRNGVASILYIFLIGYFIEVWVPDYVFASPLKTLLLTVVIIVMSKILWAYRGDILRRICPLNNGLISAYIYFR